MVARNQTVEPEEKIIIPKELRHTFTPEERQRMGDTMAQVCAEIEALEEEKAEEANRLKTAIASQQKLLRENARKLRLGWELRMIDCRMEKDFNGNVVRLYREDTNELVEERAMSIEERQRMLPGTTHEGQEVSLQ